MKADGAKKERKAEGAENFHCYMTAQKNWNFTFQALSAEANNKNVYSSLFSFNYYSWSN